MGFKASVREPSRARRCGAARRSARQYVLCCGTLCTVIKSFADKRTAAIFVGLRPKGTPADVANATRRKLAIIDRALDLADLRSPPGNRLEALRGDRQGQHSIRVNARVCFRWKDRGAEDVEFCDYH
jgi:proteic killer suppression protein